MCACGMAGEHMASPIIAFLAGAGTGYLKQRDVEDQRKRDDQDQQFRNEQREVWRKQQAEADSLNQSLKQAQPLLKSWTALWAIRARALRYLRH